jgi:hypothetical protein
MRAGRFFLTSLTSLLLGAAACSGIATAPSEPEVTQPAVDPSLGELLGGITKGVGGLLNATLLQCTPLSASKTSQDVGPLGGVVVAGPHVLVIPPGALSKKTTITAEVISGKNNSVKFGPEGLKFRYDALLTMSYKNCSGLGMLLPKKIVYTDNLLNLLEILKSLDLSGQKLVTAPLEHFSRYAIAF